MVLLQYKTWIGWVLSVSLICLILGCSSHENPLTTNASDSTGHFLVQASIAAEKTLKVYQPGQGGGYYDLCMRGKLKKTVCQNLYRAMVSYAKNTQNFKSLTVQDLTDKAVFYKVEDDYKSALFNSLG